MGSRVPTGPGWWWREPASLRAPGPIAVQVYDSTNLLRFSIGGGAPLPVRDDGRWLAPIEPLRAPHPMTVDDALHALAEHPGPIAEAAREELRGQPLDAVVDLARIRAAVRELEAALVAVRGESER